MAVFASGVAVIGANLYKPLKYINNPYKAV
jgi:hypothetical protein